MKTPLPRAPVLAVVAALALSGCSILMPPTQVKAPVAPQWQAPLPHGGTVTDLTQWWQSHGDPALVTLIEAAQQVSPGVAQALTRIESAKANQALAGSALLPQVTAQLGAQRGVSAGVPLSTAVSGGLQTAWELDLVGANRTVNQAALAQVQSTQALWHDARVAVAAEVAQLHHAQRLCHQQLAVLRQDLASRQDSARLVGVSVKAGLASAADEALAQSAVAESAARTTQQAQSCDMNVKAMVALTGLPDEQVTALWRTALAHADGSASVPDAEAFVISAIPAQTIAQRPDVFAAERDVIMASAQVGASQAQRYPRLTLSGAIGGVQTTRGATTTDLTTWSFGPLAVTLPVFDSGARAANVNASQANYQQAVSVYQAKVRQAVREVEDALLALQSTQARSKDMATLTASADQVLRAAQLKFDQGLISRLALEDAKRQALSVQSAQAALQFERRRAWIALYRASGGGFVPAQP